MFIFFHSSIASFIYLSITTFIQVLGTLIIKHNHIHTSFIQVNLTHRKSSIHTYQHSSLTSQYNCVQSGIKYIHNQALPHSYNIHSSKLHSHRKTSIHTYQHSSHKSHQASFITIPSYIVTIL